MIDVSDEAILENYRNDHHMILSNNSVKKNNQSTNSQDVDAENSGHTVLQ